MEAALSAKHASGDDPPIHAVSAEFGSPQSVLAAANTLRPMAFGRLEIYSPVPIDGAVEAIGRSAAPIPYYMAIGGAVVGFAAMMGMCVYATAQDYVFDIGGRPLVSWPAFIVPSVSFATLTAALTVFFNMTFLNRLPLLNHPAFNIPGFGRASQDRFFLMVAEAGAPLDLGAVETALADLVTRPIAVARVPR